MLALRYTLIATILDLLYTPIWWYTGGTWAALAWFGRSTRATWNMLAIGVWLANLFTPMFQQYDWQGRIISFFMRLVQIIIRSIGLVIMVAIYGIAVIAWLSIPVAVVYVALQSSWNTFVPLTSQFP